MLFSLLFAAIGLAAASTASQTLTNAGNDKLEEGHSHRHHHHHHHHHRHHSGEEVHHHHHHRRRRCRHCPPKPEGESSSSSSSYHRPLPHPSYNNRSSWSSSSSSSSSSHHHHHRCTPEQLQFAAISLTKLYQNKIAACQYLEAEALGTSYAFGQINEHACANPEQCCQTKALLNTFNSVHYDSCDWNVYWLNSEPMTAIVRPCGSVVVSAVTVETNKEDTLIKRIYVVDFIWKHASFGPFHIHSNFCGLRLHEIKYRSYDCASWNVQTCSNCQ